MDPAAAKQQIAERVKQATKFLVTVNSNPTVDQLAACIGLTLMLNKMDKHATAVFSGKVPSTIEFLQPEKTLETNTDSLRDFIISLDKNKADKLRYKVEDQFVRIFITPYRTSISEKDLVFSEGDFNVEAVIALGVSQRTQLDAAITAHGRILHDATVISINAGDGKAPDLGQINWQDPAASSLCEMLVSISESFGSGLIDNQIATAFLTGIVSETERFSNNKTSPKVMTMSAQLMAAGANQQLIAEKLEPPPPPPPPPNNPPPLPPKPKEPPAAPPPKPPEPKKPKGPPLKPEGVLDVSHNKEKRDDGSEIEIAPTEIHIDEQGNIKTAEAPPPAPAMPADPMPIPNIPVPGMEPAPEPPHTAPVMQPQAPAAPLPPLGPVEEQLQPLPTPMPKEEQLQPLNAQPPQPPAPENKHAYVAPPASFQAPASGQPDWAAPYDLVPMDPFSAGGGVNEDAPSGRPMTVPSQAQVDNSVDEIGVASSVPVAQPPSNPLDSARSAVQGAIAAAPFDPAFAPPVASLNAQPLAPAQPAAPAMPQMKNSDTPMLVLPSNTGPGSASQPDFNPFAAPVTASAAPVAPAAPPPVPPPIMAAPPR